jgi:hypothetical protein
MRYQVHVQDARGGYFLHADADTERDAILRAGISAGHADLDAASPVVVSVTEEGS